MRVPFSRFKLVLSFVVVGGLLLFFFRLRHQVSFRLSVAYFQVQHPEKILAPEEGLGNLLSYPPLHTRGRDVIDAKNQRFKLASVNWYGASDFLFVPGGLDVRHRDDISKAIKRLGFNSVRLPYSDEMVMDNPLIPAHLLAANADLVGLRALDIFIAVVNSLTDAGIAIIVNNHITQATWCCGANLCDAAWHNDYLGPICRVSMSESQWLSNWATIMTPFLKNSLVIGADLRNEVRGPWGTMYWSQWASAAERAGNLLLSLRPDWLIFVEGISSSNDLSGVWNRPIILDVPDRVVYSAHVYSWSGWGSFGGMYAARSYSSFAKSMKENWGYILENQIAPVWVSEFGAPHQPENGDANYWKNLLRYLKSIDADFGYWAINPRKPFNNEEETYGLLEDDWETPILDYRMRDMSELIRQ
ncbi:cellulase [Xylogone sp. PMI_703]|nr:cellulase [Xylogone sp. PMI_703]